MLRTEEEAKKCWCPFARASREDSPETGNHAANRDCDGAALKSSKCIASECMAWRWHGYRDKDGVWWVPDQQWPGSHNALAADEPRPGFCGLAGRAA